METTVIIEPEDQPSVTIVVEAAPEIIFEEAGIQGPSGPGPESGDGILVVGDVVHVSIDRLTLAP